MPLLVPDIRVRCPSNPDTDAVARTTPSLVPLFAYHAIWSVARALYALFCLIGQFGLHAIDLPEDRMSSLGCPKWYSDA